MATGSLVFGLNWKSAAKVEVFFEPTKEGRKSTVIVL